MIRPAAVLKQTRTQSLLGGGFGKEMRDAQRVMGRTNSGKVAFFPLSSPQSFARRQKATGYESGPEKCSEVNSSRIEKV